MLVRSMRPNVVAVDEIGDIKDCDALLYGAYCGCKILTTIHAFSIEDIKQKEGIKGLIKEKIFRRFIEMSMDKGIRKIKIYDQDFKNIF
jgi:stage III sporulation protein AA